MKLSRQVVRREVAFSDTDMAGIVHFSNYFRYMEAAEAAFFEALEEPLIEREPTRANGWPRVRAWCDFKAPLRFGDTVEIELLLEEIKIRALVFRFNIYRIDGDQRERVAKGGYSTIYVHMVSDGTMKSLAIRDSLLAKIEAVGA